MKLILLTKDDEWSRQAFLIARNAVSKQNGSRQIQWIKPEGKPILDEQTFEAIKYSDLVSDTMISFLCPWVIPQFVLDRFKLAINFHPASVDYPGIGCYNFALYDGVKEYGAVCHHMAARVDTGAIIEERRFPILASETVESLKQRTMAVMLGLFAEIVSKIATGTPLPVNSLKWTRQPYTRKELNALCKIDAGMDEVEIDRRVRATSYPGFPASIELANIRFEANSQASSFS